MAGDQRSRVRPKTPEPAPPGLTCEEPYFPRRAVYRWRDLKTPPNRRACLLLLLLHPPFAATPRATLRR